MARWLVWTCGGVVAVGVLILLCAAPAAHQAEQARTAPSARPAPSTPAPTDQIDPALRIELAIQQKLIKDGYLVPPSADASPEIVKAYTYIMEAKGTGMEDAEALREAAERIRREKDMEHDLRVQEHKRLSQERAERNRQKMEEHKARALDRMSPEAAARIQAQPRPPIPEIPPAVETPENPLPTPGK